MSLPFICVSPSSTATTKHFDTQPPRPSFLTCNTSRAYLEYKGTPRILGGGLPRSLFAPRDPSSGVLEIGPGIFLTPIFGSPGTPPPPGGGPPTLCGCVPAESLLGGFKEDILSPPPCPRPRDGDGPRCSTLRWAAEVRPPAQPRAQALACLPPSGSTIQLSVCLRGEDVVKERGTEKQHRINTV